jgi:hypothetical protein
MNIRSIPNFVSAAALAAVLQFGTSAAHAVSAPVVPLGSDEVIQSSQFQRVEWTEERRIKLRRAFWLLEHANADYDGHKVKAMEHIKKAGESLGMDLHGKGYEGEHKQGTSDERLREAKVLLKDVMKESENHAKEYAHLENALREINHALKVN